MQNANLAQPAHDPTRSVMDSPRSQSTKNRLLVVLGLGGVLVLGLGVLLWSRQQTPRETAVQPTTLIKPAAPQEKVIAKVGEESIYASDLGMELTYYPAVTEVEGQPVKEYLLDKIVLDSILLQELADPSLLDQTTYNSPTKDYLKRTKLTQELRAKQEASLLATAPGQEGTLLSIWFYNERFPKYTRDEAKSIAQKKITSVHEQLKSGAINVEKAIASIKDDASLRDLDFNYQGNASLQFKVVDRQNSTLSNISPSLLQEVLSLPGGGITKIYEAKISANEEFFIFAVIDSVTADGEQPLTFEEWVAHTKPNYEVVIYEE